MSELLPCIEVNPEETPIGTVIWLHGLGADGNDFAPMVPELRLPKNLPLRFVFPDAPMIPVTINGGYVMRAWYDIISITSTRDVDHAGIVKTIQDLEKLIAREEELGIPAEKIVLGGFSQGSVIALTAGLSCPKTLKGILALSGYLTEPEKVIHNANPANLKTPIFLGHGRLDNVVPFFLCEQIHEALVKNDHPVSYHPYPIAHTVSAEEIQDLSTWLQTLYQ